MVFSTLTFLFLFFPIVFILYYLIPNRTYKNVVLLIASIIFYGWGEPKYIILMLAASFTAYIGGLLIHRFGKSGNQSARKTAFIITVILLTSNLFIFKYLNFAVGNLNALLTNSIIIREIALPIGISFYTFQILSYVIDLYNGKIGLQRNFFYLTLYVTFFPQLIAGPIVRYQTVEHEIRTRTETVEDVTAGLRRFVIGLSKKVIIANNVGAVASLIFEGDTSIYGTQFYWLAALAYALQIYFDFSGYSDMAIGLGRMFGFHFLENFNFPYIATSTTDFWRRWHISLSTWFRDYIYIPLGGNRVSKGKWIRNICIVWALTGFWHGAQWNFLLWGVYYAVLLLAEKLFLGKILEKLPKILSWAYAFILVLVGWVIFSTTNLTHLWHILHTMFSLSFTDTFTALIANTDILYSAVYIPLGLICMFPWSQKLKINEDMQNIACLLLLGICIVFILGSAYNPFIYFRF